MSMINHPAAVATDGQQLIKDFTELAQNLQIGLSDGSIQPIDFAGLPQKERADVALALISKEYRVRVGHDSTTEETPRFCGKVVDLVQMYHLGPAIEVVAKQAPNHPMFAIDPADEDELCLIIANFCMAVCLPETDLNDPQHRQILRPLFIMGCNFLAIANAFKLREREETTWLEQMLGSLAQSGVMKP